MDDHTLRVLEFEKVLDMASSHAITEPGRQVVRGLRPLDDPVVIEDRINCISGCRKFYSENHSLGIEHFDDLTSLFRKLKPEDAVLDPMEMRSLLPLFYSAYNLKILSNESSLQGLNRLLSGFVTHAELKKLIERSIDSDGRIRDEASAELNRIRKGIKSIDKKIKAVLEDLLDRKDLEPHIQDYYITQRNNRWVIPVKKDSKGSVPGIVHDISNTGESVFIEPFTVQQLGNELEALRAEEKLEMHRILRHISGEIRLALDDIEGDYSIVADVDAVQSLARFAEQMDMDMPVINQKGFLRIVRGRHPLLWKTLKAHSHEDSLVPLDIELGSTYSGIIITGSNAGGKTVALKTTGVIILMALSGMHVPASAGTEVPLLRAIYADIGDEQSIEDNLSTFSAHIRRISEIIGKSGKDTLVVVDELGTGTDPEQGGALSCAVLKKLKQLGSLVVISTHLGRLKAFAHSEEGFINSSMEMKEVTRGGETVLKPTYRLILGEPGTSHAFEIAESLGMQPDIINEARQIIGNGGEAVDFLVTDLKRRSSELARKLDETERLRRELEDMKSACELELASMKQKEKETMACAYREAEEIIRKAKQDAHGLIEEMKRAQRDERRRILEDIKRRQDELKMQLRKLTPTRGISPENMRQGQRVLVNALGREGKIISVNKKSGICKLIVGEKEIVVAISELSEFAGTSVAQGVTGSSGRLKAGHIPSEGYDVEVPPEIKLIGERVDPALSRIERYLNDATLAGLKQVRIIHGIGTGILARSVREYLRDHPLVESIRSGSEDEGGAGVTVVTL